jgi:hypothetical protein
LKNKIIKAWDRFIYKHAFHTIKRMSVDVQGFTYLMELQIRKWNEMNPIPNSLKNATETFFEAMEQHVKK